MLIEVTQAAHGGILSVVGEGELHRSVARGRGQLVGHQRALREGRTMRMVGMSAVRVMSGLDKPFEFLKSQLQEGNLVYSMTTVSGDEV